MNHKSRYTQPQGPQTALEKIAIFDEFYASCPPENQIVLDAYIETLCKTFRQFGPKAAKELLAVVLSHKAAFDRCKGM